MCIREKAKQEEPAMRHSEEEHFKKREQPVPRSWGIYVAHLGMVRRPAWLQRCRGRGVHSKVRPWV